jgi:hypothetical protein
MTALRFCREASKAGSRLNKQHFCYLLRRDPIPHHSVNSASTPQAKRRLRAMVERPPCAQDKNPTSLDCSQVASDLRAIQAQRKLWTRATLKCEIANTARPTRPTHPDTSCESRGLSQFRRYGGRPRDRSSYQRCRRVLGNMSTPQRYFFWAVQHPNQIAMGWRSRSKYDRAGYHL